MNLQEFKAWFEGFSENMTDTPTKVQWDKIKAKIATIEDKPPMSYPVFVDRYRHWYESWPYRPMYATAGNITTSLNAVGNTSGKIELEKINFNSFDAFKEMGKAEAVQ